MAKTKAQKAEKRVRMSTRRSANFTHHEKQVLLSLMQEYRQVVEDRHTDGVTVREKNTAWIDLTNKYNAENDVSARSVKQLRQCWKNLKSRSRVDFLSVPGEGGSNDSTTLTLIPTNVNVTTSSSSNVGSAGSGSALTLVAVGGGMSDSTNANEGSGSSPSNNTSSIDNAGTIILNNILTNNSSNIIHNNTNNLNSIRPTNGIESAGDLSSHSGSPGLTSFGQSLASSTTANRQRPESKTSSSNKKRKKRAPAKGKSAAAAVEDRIDEVATEVTRSRRKSRPTLVHLNYDENGVLDDGETVAEVERPRRKTRPSVMHLDYVSTAVDDDDDEDGAVVADEDVSDRLQVSVGYPHDSAVVVGQHGHSQEPEDVYPTDTLAVVSVSGSADRIHFNNHASSSHIGDIHHHPQVNLHPQPQTGYRLSQHNPNSPHHIQIQSSAFQPSHHLTANSNHLEDDLNHHTDDSGADIKVFDSIRGFGKVLHTQTALPTHLVSHVTDGRTVHSVNLGPSINYNDEVDIVNTVPSSHSGPQIVSTVGGANNHQIPSIEPVLLEKVCNEHNDDPIGMGFHKTEHSERMKNIRLERRLIGVEHKARMELIKLKSEYVKMKMEALINDTS